MKNPYQYQPPRSFWSSAVARDFDPIHLVDGDEPLLRLVDRIVSAGSCFASNLVPWIERAGFTYLRTESPVAAFASGGENLGYANFSAAYGNIYTARQLLQLYKRAIGQLAPRDPYWFQGTHVVDPFRPGLRFPAESVEEFIRLTDQHLSCVRQAFETATVMIFTLGLTEFWEDSQDGTAYPSCPGTISRTFDPRRYRFRNQSVEEVAADVIEFISLVKLLNPDLRLVLTVSPVPLVATAGSKHVLAATTYSKSVLRVAADEVCRQVGNSHYFPAYEIVTGSQAPHDSFEADRRSVSESAIASVMRALLLNSENSDGQVHHPSKPSTIQQAPTSDSVSAQELSLRLAEAECDEVMVE